VANKVTLRTLGHDSAGECGGCVDQVLAVVEHQQEPAAAERLYDALLNRLARLLSHTEDCGRGVTGRRGVQDRRELHLPHTILEVWRHLGGDL
jgi:hypothetical protein